MHTHFKQKDLDKYKMNTYINLEAIINKMNIPVTPLSAHYYLEILKPINSTEGASFPYQYSVDNF